ncbi:hypothetical protein ABVT39_017316 [Epinephelus coioides]
MNTSDISCGRFSHKAGLLFQLEWTQCGGRGLPSSSRDGASVDKDGGSDGPQDPDRLQRGLLDHLESQINPDPQAADSRYQSAFHASTPATPFSNPRRYSEGESLNSSSNSSVLQSRRLPDKFDGDAAMQPDDWLQAVALYKEACGLSDTQLFLEMPRFLAKEPKKWFSAMQPHLSSWAQFSDLFRQAFLPSDNQENIWRGILDRVQRPDEPLPTFVTHRLALYGSSLGSIYDLLLKAHELHSALGPVSSERYEPSPRAQSRQKLHCFKCMAPGATTHNCVNCRRDKEGVRVEPSHAPPPVHESDGASAGKVGENKTSPQMDQGAHTHKFQKGGRNDSKGPNSNNGRNFSGAGPSLNLVQHTATRLGQPTKADILVEASGGNHGFGS